MPTIIITGLVMADAYPARPMSWWTTFPGVLIPLKVLAIIALIRMGELEPGTVLEIWSRDHFAPMEIPIWAARDGHHVVARGREGARSFRYFVFDVTKAGLVELGEEAC